MKGGGEGGRLSAARRSAERPAAADRRSAGCRATRPSLGCAAARRLKAWGPHLAVIYGSGLWAPPRGARLLDEIPYEELGWPVGDVPGHDYALRLAAVNIACADNNDVLELRLALACGRPHAYEGWSADVLEKPVRALVAAGVGRLLLTNSCGALRAEVAVGAAIVCPAVVDLQRPPGGESPEILPVCDEPAATCVTAALRRPASAPGAYVAVSGPQFETPAEVAWLSRYGAVVGMSAAPEARAARASGAECCLLGLVANVAAAVASHDEVLAAGDRLAGVLAADLVPAALARWPGLASASRQGVGETPR